MGGRRMSKPRVIKHTYSFSRRTLKRIHMTRYSNNIIVVTTYILDRNSLHVRKVQSQFTDWGLQLICMMYFQAHINDTGVRTNVVETEVRGVPFDDEVLA
jgi:hypothetical protein